MTSMELMICSLSSWNHSEMPSLGFQTGTVFRISLEYCDHRAFHVVFVIISLKYREHRAAHVVIISLKYRDHRAFHVASVIISLKYVSIEPPMLFLLSFHWNIVINEPSMLFLLSFHWNIVIIEPSMLFLLSFHWNTWASSLPCCFCYHFIEIREHRAVHVVIISISLDYRDHRAFHVVFVIISLEYRDHRAFHVVFVIISLEYREHRAAHVVIISLEYREHRASYVVFVINSLKYRECSPLFSPLSVRNFWSAIMVWESWEIALAFKIFCILLDQLHILILIDCFFLKSLLDLVKQRK